MVMNWRLGLLLIALVVVFAVVSALVIRRTQEAQAKVEAFHSRLAGNAQDALSNVVVVQSFTRLNSEARMFGDIIRQVLDHQFPVLNWWAIVSVLTRAASTICVIAIFVYGTVLHVRGQATVGEIVSFMGFATLLIGRLEGAVGFVSHMVFVQPRIAELFDVLDARSSVPEAPDAQDIGRAERRGRLRGRRLRLSRRPAPSCATCPSPRARARPSRWSARPAPASPPPWRCCNGCGTRRTGRITLDGHDLRDITLESLRAQHRRGVPGIACCSTAPSARTC